MKEKLKPKLTETTAKTIEKTIEIREKSKSNPEIERLWNEAKKGNVSVSFAYKKATNQPVDNLGANKRIYEQANIKLRELNKKLRDENKELKAEVKRLSSENWELQKRLYQIINDKFKKGSGGNNGGCKKNVVSIANVRKQLKNNRLMGSAGEGKSFYYENPYGRD